MSPNRAGGAQTWGHYGQVHAPCSLPTSRSPSLDKSPFLSLSSTTLQGLSGSALVREGNSNEIEITHLSLITLQELKHCSFGLLDYKFYLFVCLLGQGVV